MTHLAISRIPSAVGRTTARLVDRAMRLAALSLAFLTLALVAPAQAGTESAIATASVTVLDRGGFQAPSALTFAPLRSSASAALDMPSGNAQLTINGQAGDTFSILAPSSLTLVRNGGDEVLTASTRAISADQFGGQDLMTGGSVMRAGSMKVDIGCNLTQASRMAPPPGAYEGQFVVLIQYN